MSSRREAAACVERGIERYAEGQYVAAQRELEQALALHPGHPRALECLAWVREIAAGRRAPSSDKYAVIEADDYGPAPLQPTRAGIPTRSSATRIPAQSSSSPALPSQGVPPEVPSMANRSTQRTVLGLPPVLVPPGADASSTAVSGTPPAADHLPEPPARLERATQLDDAPESVTREWSSMATSSLPQLDVPELSEEQIANLLDMDRGQGFTLSAGKIDDSDADEDEADRTNIRAAHLAASVDSSVVSTPDAPAKVYEMVAEPEDDVPNSPFVSRASMTPADPVLPPLSSASPPGTRSSPSIPTTAKSSPSIARPEPAVDDVTNPFVQQKLVSLAPLLSGPSAAEHLETALQRGDKREIFEVAEQIVERGGAAPVDDALVMRAYEQIIGRLDAVPRYGKAGPDLDSRSAFLLSRIDGAMTIDDLLDISGMPRRDALRVLARLVLSGTVVTS